MTVPSWDLDFGCLMRLSNSFLQQKRENLTIAGLCLVPSATIQALSHNSLSESVSGCFILQKQENENNHGGVTEGAGSSTFVCTPPCTTYCRLGDCSGYKKPHFIGGRCSKGFGGYGV